MRRASILVSSILLGLIPTLAFAESYQCTIDNRYSRGWFAERYDITVNAQDATLQVAPFRGGEKLGTVTARLTANNDRRIAGSFLDEDARTSTGRKLNVRYTATIRRSDLRFTGNARVGNGGQSEHARGTCVRLN